MRNLSVFNFTLYLKLKFTTLNSCWWKCIKLIISTALYFFWIIDRIQELSSILNPKIQKAAICILPLCVMLPCRAQNSDICLHNLQMSPTCAWEQHCPLSTYAQSLFISIPQVIQSDYLTLLDCFLSFCPLVFVSVPSHQFFI